MYKSLKLEIKEQVIKALMVEKLSVRDASSREVTIERPKDSKLGDFSTNIAMVLGKELKCNPRDLATAIIAELNESTLFSKVELAGPGFINFFVKPAVFHKQIERVLEEGIDFGSGKSGEGRSVLLEFVSANPTGPLHVGHGRGAVIGSALANILRFSGYLVTTEYYVNDSGRQIDILAYSVFLSICELLGNSTDKPAFIYLGNYISEIASQFVPSATPYFINVAREFINISSQNLDDEKHLDSCISALVDRLGSEEFSALRKFCVSLVLQNITSVLKKFGVNFDSWISEEMLLESGEVGKAIDRLNKKGCCYVREGATWFNSKKFGDDKDRVLIRENGRYTYFGTDVAYHYAKVEKGYSELINIWGSDHHGYIPRIRASLIAGELEADRLKPLLVQFASLVRNGKKETMSTRKGTFITLEQLMEEVGKDAARFFYLLRKSEQHIEFDIELAKRQTSENPVYYIQYAFARISSVLKRAREIKREGKNSEISFNHESLDKSEKELIVLIDKFPEEVRASSTYLEPSLIAQYLRDLAAAFHASYAKNKILVDDEDVTAYRLKIARATHVVIKSALNLLGIESPETM